MATLSFQKEGEYYVSEAFQGGKVIQLSFPSKSIRVLFIESRLGVTLSWKTVGNELVERDMIINVPAAGDGQEFRLRCEVEPAAAEIVPMTPGGGGGGSQPGPDTVGTEQIQDGAVQMEDLNQSVKDEMVTGNDRVTQEELDGFMP